MGFRPRQAWTRTPALSTELAGSVRTALSWLPLREEQRGRGLATPRALCLAAEARKAHGKRGSREGQALGCAAGGERWLKAAQEQGG